MLLKRLAEYSQRLEPRPALYAETPVRYLIELDRAGNVLNPEPTDTADPASPRTRRGQRRLMPQIQRSVGIKPILLGDKAEYTLDLAEGSARASRVVKCHHAYLDLVRRCAERSDLPELRAVLRFLTDDPLSRLKLPCDFDRGATMTFRVDGIFPVDLPAVQQFWADEHDQEKTDPHGVQTMQCIVCGETRPVLARLQTKIKGIPGGQTSGTALISANAEAFESYGLHASLIAPTCARCGEGFTRAANELLSKEANHLVTGGAVFIFWTREPCEFSFRDFLLSPQPEQVRALIESVRAGRRPAGFKDTSFYAAALSASGGRVVVRDWIDTTVAELQLRLKDWFERQRIVGPGGEQPRPFGLIALAGATVRELRDLAPPVPRALMRSALTGAPVPFDLLYQAVRRNRAEQKVTQARAALIRLVLSFRPEAAKEADAMVHLDEENQNPAYLCGRLLAVLEQTQWLAVRPKAGLVDRYYGAASSTPRVVFPSLLRLTRAHLTKLERDHPAARAAIERRMEEIIGGIASFPPTLTLEEQGLFSLGYYHQRAHDRGQAAAAKAARDEQRDAKDAN